MSTPASELGATMRRLIALTAIALAALGRRQPVR